jgi:hypothetical protein
MFVPTFFKGLVDIQRLLASDNWQSDLIVNLKAAHACRVSPVKLQLQGHLKCLKKRFSVALETVKSNLFTLPIYCNLSAWIIGKAIFSLIQSVFSNGVLVNTLRSISPSLSQLESCSINSECMATHAQYYEGYKSL